MSTQYPNHPSDMSAMTGGYVPYFYQAGIFQRYGRPAVNVPPRSSFALDEAAEFRSGMYPDRLQTVEQIVASGYFAVPPGDLAMSIISDKNHTSRLGLDDVIGQIRSRYEIFQENLYDIELSKCSALNALFIREAEEGKPSDSRQEYSVSKVLQGLYKQEREERVSLWQDVSKLKLVLPELAQNYLTAYRKNAILNNENEEDDAP